jgi:hypothetical protein
MQEAGVVIGRSGQVLHWHLPESRTITYLPDSRTLWDVLWENRRLLVGFAHTHPGTGIPAPSYEDVTTFAAIEAALGRRLVWWIVSDNRIVTCLHRESGKRLDYEVQNFGRVPEWVYVLRRESGMLDDSQMEDENGS